MEDCGYVWSLRISRATRCIESSKGISYADGEHAVVGTPGFFDWQSSESGEGHCRCFKHMSVLYDDDVLGLLKPAGFKNISYKSFAGGFQLEVVAS